MRRERQSISRRSSLLQKVELPLEKVSRGRVEEELFILEKKVIIWYKSLCYFFERMGGLFTKKELDCPPLLCLLLLCWFNGDDLLIFFLVLISLLVRLFLLDL